MRKKNIDYKKTWINATVFLLTLKSAHREMGVKIIVTISILTWPSLIIPYMMSLRNQSDSSDRQTPKKLASKLKTKGNDFLTR